MLILQFTQFGEDGENALGFAAIHLAFDTKFTFNYVVIFFHSILRNIRT